MSAITSERVRRTRPRGPMVVTFLATLLLIASVVWAAFQYRSLAHQKDVEDAGADAVATAADVVPTLLTYDPENLQQDLAAARAELTPRFRPEFERLQKELIGPAIGEGKLATQATVEKVGITEATRSTVDLLVFLEQKTTKAGTESAPINTRAVVRLKRVDGRWLVDMIKPV